MIEATFVDANVLIYQRDSSEPLKQQKATAWLDFLWHSKQGRLSVQVLNEFYVIVTRKLKPGMDIKAARADVRALMTWQPIPIDRVVVEKACDNTRSFFVLMVGQFNRGSRSSGTMSLSN